MPDRHGPVKTGRFEVEIDGVEVPGWQTVTIPSISVEQGSYREGNEAKHEKKLWGQVTYDDLKMERGFDPDSTELVEWRRAIQAGKADEGRKEIAVKLLDGEKKKEKKKEKDETVLVQWEFDGAWIKEYDPPNLDASADGEVATESVTIAYDEMIRKDP